jgi:hypothetical protein
VVIRRQAEESVEVLYGREALADLLAILCGATTVVKSFVLNGLSFDAFSFDEDGLTASEVDVGWRPY